MAVQTPRLSGPWQLHEHAGYEKLASLASPLEYALASNGPSAGNWADMTAQVDGGSTAAYALTHSVVIEDHFSAVSAIGMVMG